MVIRGEKMGKKSSGIVSVEASIVLTSFIFFICFVLNFGYIFRAQNFMTQVVQETGKTLSFASYRYQQGKELTFVYAVQSLADMFGMDSTKTDVMLSWNNKNYKKAAEEGLKAIIGGINDNCNQQLDAYNIDSYEITKAEVNGKNEFNLVVTYTIKLPFPVFGLDKIELHQEALYKNWSTE